MNKSIRQEFADTMLEVGLKDPNLVVLIGDISHFILQPFAKACPGRFYNIGICEPTIVNMASGLSRMGFFPVVHTISPFIVERSFEQIKDDFGYQKIGVNLVTVGSAFDYSDLGATHHTYGDFALIKTVSGSQIVYPGTTVEFNTLFKQTYNNGKLTYFRLPKEQHGVLFNKSRIKFGKGIKVKQGKDITIVALGSQLKNVLVAVNELEKTGISAEVLYFHTVKPLDEKLILESLSKTQKCLVVEEHGRYGGVYDDILRISSNIGGVKYSALNLGDKFIHTYGTYEEQCRDLGFTPAGIMRKVKKAVI